MNVNLETYASHLFRCVTLLFARYMKCLDIITNDICRE